MNMIEAVRSVLRQYISIRGRARPAEYWWFFLAVQLVMALFYVLAFVTIGIGAATIPSGSDEAPAFGFFIPLILFVIVTLGLIPATISVSVRRLHDTNRSGWYYLLSLVPFGGIVLLVFFVEAGTIGPNAFGEDPRAGDAPRAYPGQPYQVAPTPGIHYPHPGQAGYSSQPHPGLAASNQPYAYGGQPYPAQPYGDQPASGQPNYPAQPAPGQPATAQPYGGQQPPPGQAPPPVQPPQGYPGPPTPPQ